MLHTAQYEMPTSMRWAGLGSIQRWSVRRLPAMHPGTCMQAVHSEKLTTFSIETPLETLLPQLTTFTINTDRNVHEAFTFNDRFFIMNTLFVPQFRWREAPVRSVITDSSAIIGWTSPIGHNIISSVNHLEKRKEKTVDNILSKEDLRIEGVVYCTDCKTPWHKCNFWYWAP